MRRSKRQSSIGIGLGVEERLSSNTVGSFSTRFSLSSFAKRVEKLTANQRNAIRKVGFGNLLLIPNQMLSKNLLAELMERWDCVERGFMLLAGMLKITLMDVALILGIRVVGDPVLLREDEAFSDLEGNYGAALWNRKIAVGSLESRLDSLGEVANEDFVRTFILFTFGTLLFPNANGKVDSRYLSFLTNLDDIGHFAWGAAVLEELFMWLNKKKESNVQYIGGCLILLQVWSYEHIDLARPDLVDCNVMFPRACRWENSKSRQRQWFTAKFKELQDHQITWQLQPTSEELQFDVINELLEVESSSIENSSDGGSVIVVAGRDKEHISGKVQVQDGGEVNSKQSIVSQYIPEVKTVGFPSTSCASALDKDVGELSSPSENSQKSTKDKVGGLYLELDVTNSCKIQVREGEEDHLKQSKASRDVPEMETEAMEFPSTASAFALSKQSVELSNSEELTCVLISSLSVSPKSSEVVGHHLELDVSSTSRVQMQKGQEVNLKQSTTPAPQNIPEEQTEAMAFPSTPSVSKLHEEWGELSSQSHNSAKFTSGREGELIERNQILEVQNMELKKEMEALKVENRQLKMQICSTNDLVTRLEGLVMEDTYSS